MENNSNNSLSNFGLRSILEKEKFNKNNFLDWSRNLRIVLKHEWKLDFLETPITDEPALNASAENREAYEAALERSLDVTCLMLASMVSKSQKQFMDIEAFHIFAQLQAMYLKQARTESFETIMSYLVCSKSRRRKFPLNQRNRFLWFRKRRMSLRKKGS